MKAQRSPASQLTVSGIPRAARARSAKRPAICAAQLELPPVQGSTGTFTGRNIQQPLIGKHFLHIDDFGKEVSREPVLLVGVRY